MNRNAQHVFWEVFKIPVFACALFGFCLILTIPAWGSSGHVHKSISPFEKNGKNKNDHCLLNKHSHQNLPCPHALLLVQKNKRGFFLSTECGGNRQGSLPAKNIFNHNPCMTTSYVFVVPLNIVEAVPGHLFLRVFHLPDSLDHPPKAV